MHTNHTTAVSEPPHQRRAAVAGALGTTIEWYDFFVYGSSAALVFADLFFPNSSPTTGTLESLATFGVAFVARPIGGLIFGNFGDRIGRKPMLVVTLLMMGLATTLIGVLPTYAAVGVWAPILLVVMRLIQGIAVGGEWGGAVGLVAETSSNNRRGLLASIVQSGSPIGLVLSTVVILAVQQLPHDALLTWGWRIPFLGSIVLVVVGLVVRLSIQESPEFALVKKTGRVERMPILAVITESPRNAIFGILACSSVNVAFYASQTFGLVYGKDHGLSSNEVLVALLINAGIIVFAEPAYGALSGRVGAKPVFLFGGAFLICWAPFMFTLAGSGNVLLFGLALFGGLALAHAPGYGTQAGLFYTLFPARTRYSGISLSYQLGGLLTSAPTPFLAAYLVGKFHSNVPLVGLLIFAGALTVVSTLMLRPVTGLSTDDTAPRRRGGDTGPDLLLPTGPGAAQ